MQKLRTLFLSAPFKIRLSFFIATFLIAFVETSGLVILGELVSSIFSSEFDPTSLKIDIFGVLVSYVLVVIFFSARFVFISICNYFVGKSIFNIAEHYSARIYNKMIDNTRYRELSEADEKASMIAVDTNTLINTFLIPLAGLVTETLLASGIYIVLFYIHPVGATFCLIFGVFLVLSIQKTIGYFSKQIGYMRQAAEQSRLEAIQRAADFKSSIDVYGLKTWLENLFYSANRRVTESGSRQFFVMFLPKYFYELVFVCALLGGLAFSGAALDGSYLVILLVMRLMPALNRVSACWTSFTVSIAASERIVQVIASDDASQTLESHERDSDSMRDNEFHLDVAWDNDNVDREIFPNINPFQWDFYLEIKRGDIIAISGPSGVGKSTLLKSVIGQSTRPSQVKNNGDVVSVLSRLWLDNFAYVPQESRFFAGSIRENILMGRDNDEQLISEVTRSAMLFDVGDVSRELNLETLLGADGSVLSGGQLQRLSLARALYGRPSILLLDEFTSGLDENTEKAIIDTVQKFSSDIAIVAVSHRPVFNTIANKAVVFKEGMPKWA
ncbi:ABC transporter ATP-binding protein/permease [Luminiphilus sp.]|nr:ABC transporter ATP-binding protein/permease [Luminiphilus sp.]